MTDAQDNPFAASEAVDTKGLQPLYSDTACMVTTFFGTPLLAAPLLMINAQRTDQNPFLIGGLSVLVVVAALLVGEVLPDNLPNVVYTVAQLMAVRQIHRGYFHDAVLLRQEQGIPFAPWLHAALLCLIGFTASLMLMGTLVWFFGLEGLSEL